MNRFRLNATFRPQIWVNDYAVDVEGGAVKFDATTAFLRLSLDEIKAYKEHNYSSDELSAGLTERHEHDGPFEVDADVDEWLGAHGHPDRKQLTAADLAALRTLFEVVEINQ